jgi:hypothetical protein
MFKEDKQKPNYEELLTRLVGGAKSQLVQWINQVWVEEIEASF